MISAIPIDYRASWGAAGQLMTNDNEHLYPSQLVRAARALVAKLDRIDRTPEWNAVWIIYYNHGGKWPPELNWTAELDALRALLAKEPT
jgi:hypothetical protein